jgi:hypothetical protein
MGMLVQAEDMNGRAKSVLRAMQLLLDDEEAVSSMFLSRDVAVEASPSSDEEEVEVLLEGNIHEIQCVMCVRLCIFFYIA